MLVSRTFLHYFAVEILFGVPRQFGLETPEAMAEAARIFSTGLFRPH
jgi:hypothetical protein